MNYITRGVLDTIFNEETVGQKNFKKRVCWLQTDEQYSQLIEIQFNQHNTDMLDKFNAGDKVEITFSINGRKTSHPTHGERVFNSNVGFQIKRL